MYHTPIARKYFRLDPRVRWHTADALTYFDDSRRRVDAIVVDACTSERTQLAFTSPAWLGRAMRHLNEGGLLTLNLAYDEKDEAFGRELAATLAEDGFYSVLLRPEDGWEGNELLLVATAPFRPDLRIQDIVVRPAESRSYLLSLKQFHYSAKTQLCKEPTR